MSTFLRILRYGRPYGKGLPLYIVSTVLHSFFSVINISMLIPLFQILFEEKEVGAPTEPVFSWSFAYLKDLFYFRFEETIFLEGKLAALYFVTGLIIASFLFSNVFSILSAYLIAKIRVRVISNFRKEAFDRTSKFDLSYFTSTKKGDVVTRITTDIQQVEGTVVGVLKALVKEPLLIIGFFFVLFNISVELTLYTMAIIPLSGGAISYLTKRLRRRARLGQAALANITAILDEALTGIRIIKAFDARKYILQSFNEEVDRYSRHNVRMSIKQSMAHPVSEFFGVLVLSAILLIGGSLVLTDSSSLTGASFVGFLVIFSQILNPAKSFSKAIGNIQKGLVSAERVFELIDAEPKISNKPDAKSIAAPFSKFQFEQVAFGYEDNLVIEDIDFTLEKGQVVALVGPSGGGKSTIADLLPRFYDPKAGKVSVDGIDLRDLDLNELRRLMGIVTQESILFHDTIARNIAFGKPDASEEEIWEAAEKANAADFIKKLPEGVNEMIGERGLKLSGGQRQRISIARAILRNPPVLILDEATSALDSQAETLVQEAIFRVMQDRTTLVIAHRLSTIRKADLILVVADGKIVERGKHEDLSSTGGLYQTLLQTQSFD